MNKFTKTTIALVALVALASPSFAATASFGPVPVSAVVDGALSMTVTLKKNSTTGATVTSMDFGQLVDIGTGTLRSSTTSTTGTGSVVAVISANSHSLPQIIKQSGIALSNGTTTLPAGACTVVPVYVAADNGGAALPAGATMGTAGTWVATDKVLYNSGATGASRVIQAYYSVTDDSINAGATSFVPLTQAGGTYTGTVTFTVTA